MLINHAGMQRLTTILVQYYPDFLDDVRKDIMKYTWLHISSSDDVILKTDCIQKFILNPAEC